jgi:TolB-like protein
VLKALAARSGEVVSKDALFDAVWPGIAVTEDSLVQCVGELRRALGPDRDAVRTLPKRGYMLDAEAIAGAAAAPGRAGAPVPRVQPSAWARQGLGAAVTMLVALVAWRSLAPGAAAIPEATRAPPPGAVAVLTFEAPPGDDRLTLFARGLSNDLSFALSGFRELTVIGRASAIAVEDRPPTEAAAALGARYLLDGEIAADGDAIRATAWLTDGRTGEIVWTDRREAGAQDLLSLRGRLIAETSAALGAWEGAVLRREREGVLAEPTQSLGAYEHYLRGEWRKHHDWTQASMEAAAVELEAAIAADPGFARAHLLLSLVLGVIATNGWADDPTDVMNRWSEAVGRAVALDPTDATALAQYALLRAWKGDADGAVATIRQARDQLRGDPDSMIIVAWNMAGLIDAPAEAAALTERAFALQPFPQHFYHIGRGLTLVLAGRWAEAVAVLRRPGLDGAEPQMYLAIAEARLGRLDEARRIAARFPEAFPAFTVEGYVRDFPVIAPGAQATLREGAALAGLPLGERVVAAR